jgi:hypothetical protein
MSVNMRRERRKDEIKEKRKVKWNLTKNYHFIKYFVILPMSHLYILWSAIISIAIFYNVLLVPYCIALNVELQGAYKLFDFAMFTIYLIDIFIQFKTGMVNNKIEIDLQSVAKDYIGFKIILDILALIPIDYILYPFAIN